MFDVAFFSWEGVIQTRNLSVSSLGVSLLITIAAAQLPSSIFEILTVDVRPAYHEGLLGTNHGHEILSRPTNPGGRRDCTADQSRHRVRLMFVDHETCE